MSQCEIKILVEINDGGSQDEFRRVGELVSRQLFAAVHQLASAATPIDYAFERILHTSEE